MISSARCTKGLREHVAGLRLPTASAVPSDWPPPPLPQAPARAAMEHQQDQLAAGPRVQPTCSSCLQVRTRVYGTVKPTMRCTHSSLAYTPFLQLALLLHGRLYPPHELRCQLVLLAPMARSYLHEWCR